MFNQNIQRIGFACKVQTAESTADPKLNQSGTTIKWLSSQTPERARERLWDIMRNNIQALAGQIEYIGRQVPELRMFRMTSDLLPAYTHDDYMAFYFQSDVINFLESNLSKIGQRARELDIKLSFHPGQFCVLASEQDHVIENSIIEFEYHADIIRYMGYGREFQDFKCNVHIGGKRGPDGIKAALRRLSPEARNTLTIENAEFTWGLEHSLELVDTCALVLDIHHHWIYTGKYITPDDASFKRVVDSWRGVRPTIHYSVSREDVLVDHDPLVKPDLAQLKSMGFTSAKLRAHSEFYWNQACNDWALSFLPHADIMCESKQKNTASFELHKYKNDLLKQLP
jgi:UV DNA damage repair endonuclease